MARDFSYAFEDTQPPAQTGERDFSYAFEEEDSPSFADYARAAGAGAGELVSGVGYVLPGQMGEVVEETGQRAAEYWREGMSPAARREASKQFVEQDPVTGEYRRGEAGLATAGLAVAESLAGTGAGMGVGALATKGIGLFLSNFPRLAGALGFGAGEGAVSGVMNAQQTAQAILQAPAEQIAQAPGFAEVYWDPQFEGLEPTQRFQAARELLASTVVPKVGIGTGLTTGVLGAPMGALLGPVVTRGLPLAGNRLGATALGAGGEALQEGAQSGVESVLGNVAAQQNYDPTRGTFEGTVNQMVGGAAAGGLMGGAVGALAGADPQQQPAAPPPAPPRTAAELGVQPETVGAEKPIMEMVREKAGPDADVLVGQALGTLVQPPVTQPVPMPAAQPPVPVPRAPEPVASSVAPAAPTVEPAAPTVEPAAPTADQSSTAVPPEPAPRETSEVPRAQEVRSDQGQVPQGGREQEAVSGEGRQDLQRPAQARAEAGGAPQQVDIQDARLKRFIEPEGEMDTGESVEEKTAQYYKAMQRAGELQKLVKRPGYRIVADTGRGQQVFYELFDPEGRLVHGHVTPLALEQDSTYEPIDPVREAIESIRQQSGDLEAEKARRYFAAEGYTDLADDIAAQEPSIPATAEQQVEEPALVYANAHGGTAMLDFDTTSRVPTKAEIRALAQRAAPEGVEVTVLRSDTGPLGEAQGLAAFKIETRRNGRIDYKAAEQLVQGLAGGPVATQTQRQRAAQRQLDERAENDLQGTIERAKQQHSRRDGYLSYLRGRLGRERFERNRETIERAWDGDTPQMARRVPAGGRPLSQIMLAPEEVELADGTTATVERSAEAALTDVDERMEALRNVLDCLGRAA